VALCAHVQGQRRPPAPADGLHQRQAFEEEGAAGQARQPGADEDTQLPAPDAARRCQALPVREKLV